MGGDATQSSRHAVSTGTSFKEPKLVINLRQAVLIRPHGGFMQLPSNRMLQRGSGRYRNNTIPASSSQRSRSVNSSSSSRQESLLAWAAGALAFIGSKGAAITCGGLWPVADCMAAAAVQASDGLLELQQTRGSAQQDPAVSRNDQACSCYVVRWYQRQEARYTLGRESCSARTSQMQCAA